VLNDEPVSVLDTALVLSETARLGVLQIRRVRAKSQPLAETRRLDTWPSRTEELS
jgi:hypothetical protein